MASETQVMETKQVALVAPMQLQEITKPPQGIPNCFLPDEVIKALKPNPLLPRAKTFQKKDDGDSCAVSCRPPASLWYYPSQRKRFQHLLNDTICSCGAGRDISFLYDAASHKVITRSDELSADMAIRDKSDPSHIRKDAASKRGKSKDKLSVVVAAEEMQLVQNLGVASLDIQQYGPANLSVGEHMKHPALLPAMGPTSREQAKQLRTTLENLLGKIGFGDEKDQPTQMHHLLELVKQEQDVYNTVFHELIRQVTVDCFERGELLSALREKYNDLINRIPKQVLSLHHELVAQRALDRRLVEELARFQATVAMLTKDLERSRSHDKLVSDQAKQMEKELRTALRQSERTDELVVQFRQLYELQRSRLETRVSLLVEERDSWVNMSYLMAAKVIDANGLAAARNALQTERTWNTAAIHFAAILSDKDADCLLKIANFVEKIEIECGLLSALAANEAEVIKTKLQTLKASMMRMVTRPILAVGAAPVSGKKSARDKVDSAGAPIDFDVFLDRVRRWNQVISELSELMSGDALLTKRQRIDYCKKNFADCREIALTLYMFHKSADGSDLPSRAVLSKLVRQLPAWLEALFVRMSGDEGLGAALARYARDMDLWLASAMSQVPDPTRIPATIQVWIRRIIECMDMFDASMKMETLNLSDIMNDISNWVTLTNNEIGGDNSVISDRARELHQIWLQWLAQALIRLVPDNPTMSEDQVARATKFLLPVDQVYRAAINLGRSVDAFTELINLCLRDRIADDFEDSHALTQLKTDAHSWLAAVWELLAQIMPTDQTPSANRWAASLLPFPRLRAAINARAWEEIPESDQLYYAAAENQKTEEERDLELLDSEDEEALLAPGPPRTPSNMIRSPQKSGVATPSQQQPASAGPQRQASAGSGAGVPQSTTPAEQPQQPDQVTWVTNEGALLSYKPEEPPETRKHLSTLTDGLAAFLPDTQRSASAIPIVETLQEQLQAAEERCRELEVRARRAEHNLGELEDKMRLLQQGPPLPEGQEWRLAEDPAFAAIFEKLTSAESSANAPQTAASSGPPTAATPQHGAPAKGLHSGRKSSTTPTGATKPASTKGKKK